MAPQLPTGDDVPLLRDEATSERLQSTRNRIASAWDSFIDFAFRDNVLEVAVGLIVASAFTAVVNSFVTDILLPVISLLPFIARNLDEKFLVLKHGDSKRETYNTKKQALNDGAVVWAWGNFLDKCIRLLMIALALFVIAKVYEWTSGDKVIKKQIKCKYCRKKISEKVQPRCDRTQVELRRVLIGGNRQSDVSIARVGYVKVAEPSPPRVHFANHQL